MSEEEKVKALLLKLEGTMADVAKVYGWDSERTEYISDLITAIEEDIAEGF